MNFSGLLPAPYYLVLMNQMFICYRIATNKDGAVQCGVCDLWWLPTFSQLSKEKFQIIPMWLAEDGSTLWKCASYDGAGAKVMKMYNALSATYQAGRMDRVEDKSKHQDTRLDCHERELRVLRSICPRWLTWGPLVW